MPHSPMDSTRHFLFRENPEYIPAPARQEHQAPEPEDWLLCRTCSRPVTRTRDRIAMDGRYRHNLFNPAGILFEVTCFAAAPGCRFEGKFTEAFTWFPGYAWRFALCAECHAHLGWEFRHQASGFVGLIMTELSAS